MVFDIIIKLLLSVVFGGVVGYERQHKSRPAGLRTHILVCIGSCLVQIISVNFSRINLNYSIDPTRLGAQVISGIGFLGAGTIIKEGASIKGLTTAASLWTVACIGLATGFGLYLEAAFATFFIYIALIGLKKFEDKMAGGIKDISLEIIVDDEPGKLGLIGDALGELNVNIVNIDISRKDEFLAVIELSLRCPKNVNCKKIIDRLITIKGVKKINTV